MIRIYPATFKGTLTAPASKSHAQRLLFASALPTTATLVKNVPQCDDIDTTLQCLLDFGCTVEKHGENEIRILPFVKTNPVPTAEFNFRESGTTAHLAIPMAAAFGISANCKGGGTLLKRPLIPLSSRMAIRGVTFTAFNLPMSMKGVLQPGEYVFAGDEGSQYISGAMMALPILRDDSVIRFSSPLVDPTFVHLTVKVMKEFGIEIEETEDGYKIPGKQVYRTPGTVETTTDWGLASMWACAGCLSRSDTDLVEVTGLDSEASELYRDFKSVMALLCQDVKYLNIDASKSPNLACLYAIFAASKGSGLDITGVPQLRYKETNRMKAVADCVKALGVEAKALDDGIHMEEAKNFDYPEDTVINCMGDPWIFMSMALAAGCLHKPIILDDENCAAKIYGSFLKDYESLGGKYEII